MTEPRILTNNPQIQYTLESDMLYIQFRFEDRAAGTQVIDDQRIVDFAEDGSLYGVEFIGTAGGLDLSDLPEREKIEAAIRAIPQFKVLAT